MAQQEKTRYTDAELAEFKAIILDKLAQARHDYEELRASISGVYGNDTEDTSPTFKVLEEGAATLAKEECEHLAAHLAKFIRNLEFALVRIEHKTYGICKTTGKLIPRERLLRVPHATETIEAKESRK
jgi:RNA polymerase-binding transcription factor DksA